jgi:hypothetical protein
MDVLLRLRKQAMHSCNATARAGIGIKRQWLLLLFGVDRMRKSRALSRFGVIGGTRTSTYFSINFGELKFLALLPTPNRYESFCPADSARHRAGQHDVATHIGGRGKFLARAPFRRRLCNSTAASGNECGERQVLLQSGCCRLVSSPKRVK